MGSSFQNLLFAGPVWLILLKLARKHLNRKRWPARSCRACAGIGRGFAGTCFWVLRLRGLRVLVGRSGLHFGGLRDLLPNLGSIEASGLFSGFATYYIGLARVAGRRGASFRVYDCGTIRAVWAYWALELASEPSFFRGLLRTWRLGL